MKLVESARAADVAASSRTAAGVAMSQTCIIDNGFIRMHVRGDGLSRFLIPTTGWWTNRYKNETQSSHPILSIPSQTWAEAPVVAEIRLHQVDSANNGVLPFTSSR